LPLNIKFRITITGSSVSNVPVIQT